MTSLRRRLHLWVAAWLVLQVASLSALIPQDCCARHRPAAATQDRCHQDVAATQCPMRAANGTPCPMHRAAAEDQAAQTGHGSHMGHGTHMVHASQPGHEEHGQPANSRCAISGKCNGPMAALFALLSNYGVLTDSFTVLPDLAATAAAAATRENPIARLASPDTPPPRA